jgi:hypothetical protein
LLWSRPIFSAECDHCVTGVHGRPSREIQSVCAVGLVYAIENGYSQATRATNPVRLRIHCELADGRGEQ